MCGGHHAVFLRPDHERRAVEGAQALGGGEQVGRGAVTQVLEEIAADFPPGQQRAQSGIGDLVRNRSFGHPPVGERQAA